MTIDEREQAIHSFEDDVDLHSKHIRVLTDAIKDDYYGEIVGTLALAKQCMMNSRQNLRSIIKRLNQIDV